MDNWMWITAGIAAAIAIGFGWTWLAIWRRTAQPTIEFSGAGADACPGLGIADSGHDMLVGFILGELNVDETERTLGHLQTCTACAEKLRVIVTLHCGPVEPGADGVVHLTPEKLRRLRERTGGNTVQ